MSGAHNALRSLIPNRFMESQPGKPEGQALIKTEVDLDRNCHRNWGLAVFHRGFEFVLSYRFHSLLVQPHAQRADHMHSLRVSLCVYDESDQANALILRPPGFIRELRLRLKQGNRSRNPATDPLQAATLIATGSRSISVAIARSDAAARAVSKTDRAALPANCQRHVG